MTIRGIGSCGYYWPDSRLVTPSLILGITLIAPTAVNFIVCDNSMPHLTKIYNALRKIPAQFDELLGRY